MRIDRNNYEEYFSLYLDNELGEADRLMVEAFLVQNPDLREELDVLSQFRLQPDTELVFPDKSLLLKNGELSAEEVLLYLDGELDETMTAKAEKAIQNDDALRSEFEILKKTRLQPESIPFPDRSLLYRREEPVRMFSVYGKRIAAALIFLLLAGSILVMLNNRKANNDMPELAGNEEKNPATESVTTGQEQISRDPETIAPAIAEIENKTSLEQPSVAIAKTQKPVKSEVAQKKKEPSQTNRLPEPEESQSAIAFADPVQKKSSDPNYDFTKNSVTSLSPQPSNLRAASYTEEDYNADEQEPAGGKKNKLRGLFRKVTRTLEKRTNIEATDEDGRLLVAGLAIKLK